MSNILKKLFDSSRIVEKFNLVQRCDMAGEMINTVLKAEKANEGRIAEAESRARDIISGAADQADAAAEVIIKEARDSHNDMRITGIPAVSVSFVLFGVRFFFGFGVRFFLLLGVRLLCIRFFFFPGVRKRNGPVPDKAG